MPTIPNRNLRLALIDEVQTLRCDDDDWVDSVLGLVHAERSGVPWNSNRTDDEPMPLLETLALELPLDAEDLRSITRLTLDGDRDLFGWAYPCWWDFEPEHYVVSDLRGLEHCTSLEYLHLGQGVVQRCSLAPLRGLPALAKLSLCALGEYTELDAVLELPALKCLDISNLVPGKSPAWRRIVDELRQRGVAV